VSSLVLRFGGFEFHPESGELIAEGQRTRLEPQPAKVLFLLASRPGEVISRDDLKGEIWPADTFVDFERGINYCIRRVRTALGDTANAPRFIETLPKRGYRFLLAVETAPGGEPTADNEPIEPSPHRRAHPRLAVALILAGLGVIAAVLAAHHSTRPPTIAVTLFDNETGRPELDRAAQVFTDVLVERLAREGGRWSVIGNASLLKQRRPFQNLERIASSLHADYVVLGQLEPGPQGIAVLTHLIRARDERHLWVGRIESAAELDPRLAVRVAENVTAATIRALPPTR
jgi:DNA-binding winged helix-turn-helix (wHTH) protein/TolB-like protein